LNCEICNGGQLAKRDYLVPSTKERVAALLPQFMAAAMGTRTAQKYRDLRCNLEYFGDKALYHCSDCLTGFCAPAFTADELDSYYSKFYWDSRTDKGSAGDTIAEPKRFARGHEHRQWLVDKVPQIRSLIDFGCGECNSSIVFKKEGFASEITCYDKSERSRANAERAGLGFTNDFAALPAVDLFYSSHSLEHVPDLIQGFEQILTKVKSGGFLFFEVPNIKNRHVCFHVRKHTPHTYMISARTFEHLARKFDLELIAVEETGQKWSKRSDDIDPAEDCACHLKALLRKN
jgi:SAM-dependent methyltransferase